MELDHPDTHWERSLEQIARRFDYPATPDLTAAVRERIATGGRGRPAVAGRLAWALLAIALLLVGLLAVPQTRAALLSFFARIGAISIFVDETVPVPSPTAEATPIESAPAPATAATGSPLPTPPATATPAGQVSHSLSLYELGEPVTLDEARRATWFDLVAPEALGAPDEVYLHSPTELPAVTLVWRMDDGAPLSLTEIGIGEFANKLVHEQGITLTLVNDQSAIWLEGPHRLQLLGNWQENTLVITSNVLIWAVDDVTFRLEGAIDLAEARRIAESVP